MLCQRRLGELKGAIILFLHFSANGYHEMKLLLIYLIKLHGCFIHISQDSQSEMTPEILILPCDAHCLESVLPSSIIFEIKEATYFMSLFKY